MATKNKEKKQPEPTGDQILDAILGAVRDLYKVHAGEIKTVQEESEDKKVVVGFQCILDASESEPTATVKIRFCSTITDQRIARLEDPKQGVFTIMTKEQDAERQLEKTTGAEMGDSAEQEGI